MERTMDDADRDIVTALFIQAWWNYLTEDYLSAEEILLSATYRVLTGLYFPVEEENYIG